MAYGTVNVGQAQTDDSKFLTTEQVGTPGGLATLGADGKLTVSQQPDFDGYTKEEAEEMATEKISAHNSSSTAHPEIRSSIDALEASIRAIELKYGTEITDNAFTVSFATLNDVTVTGVWNADRARIEF